MNVSPSSIIHSKFKVIWSTTSALSRKTEHEVFTAITLLRCRVGALYEPFYLKKYEAIRVATPSRVLVPDVLLMVILKH